MTLRLAPVVLYALLLLSCKAVSQTNISGIINDYARVTAIDYTNKYVVVEDNQFFAINDTVLLIQMKGSEIVVAEDSTYGDINDIENTGNYEFLIINEKDGDTLSFCSDFMNTYSPNDGEGMVQLVTVPQYGDAVVDNVLTSKDWNLTDGTGGVLTFFCSGDLQLDANIDVAIQGFEMGLQNVNGGPVAANYGWACAPEDVWGGKKGEGINIELYEQSCGRGKNANGGGGGNTHNSGGGGGSNGGKGGSGGLAWSTNAPVGGHGGLSLIDYYSNAYNKVFLGGGGGGGHQNDGTATPGSDGGGIVIIRTQSITGNGGNILSNSGKAGVSGPDGSGGAGAGGTVLLDYQNLNGAFDVFVNGGEGGSTDWTNNPMVGPGGGGGGGVVWINQAAFPDDITTHIEGGASGQSLTLTQYGSNEATPGEEGLLLTELVLPLNFASPMESEVIIENLSCENEGQLGSVTVSIDTNVTLTYYLVDFNSGDTLQENTTGIFNDLEAGLYKYLVEGMCGENTIEIENLISDISSSSTTTDVICFGESNGTAEIIIQDGIAPFEIAVDGLDGLQNENIENLSPGTYKYSITDSLGCETDGEFTINEPDELIASLSDASICLNASTTLNPNASGGTGNLSYDWTPGGETTPTVDVAPQNDVTYSVTITDENNCNITLSSNVSVGSMPILTLTNDVTICIGETATIGVANTTGGKPNYVYTWDNGLPEGESHEVSPTSNTTYTCTVTDACDNQDTKQVNVIVNPTPEVDFTGEEGCAPIEIQFEVISPNNAELLWDFGNGYFSSEGIHYYETPGSYDITLTATDENGCSATETIQNAVNIYDNPVANFSSTPNPTNIVNSTVKFTDESTCENAITDWKWEFDDLGVSEAQHPSFTFTEVGEYNVRLEVTSEFGCTDDIILPVTIDGLFTIYVPNAFTPENRDGVNDFFPPKEIGLNHDEFEMWIFNRWGEMIYHSTSITEPWNGRKHNAGESCQIDTYVYKIKGKSIYDDKVNLIGRVTIIR